jgi:TRAP-type mannitol/chloroaromatic compound transport system permease small subunit
MKTGIRDTQSKFSDALDRFITGIGNAVMWTNALLVLVIIIQVILRYVFGRGLVALEEVQWHLYAIAFMTGLSCAVVNDAHIRIDLVHARLTDKWKSRWEFFGIVFLLLPVIALVILQGLPYFYDSLKVNESSDAPMGLPFRWAIKSLIPISFSLILVATLARLVRVVVSLKGGVSRKSLAEVQQHAAE